ncbi:phage holin family protein [Euhalothece natronophila Z-M001]|uniref:Phage holin family protein n=1 Tax=Euhalothece natronophila Z-M001 TaxID=522448 RepID=A0A5B8NQE4_9CHRO|nr:phage holin family protein [Euhalothece natronophila]QDZ41198.1 phage holin family protein [Euhalothece natronophila Z-M001]
MPQFIITWIATAIALLITAWIVPGLVINSVVAAIIGAAVLGFVNAIVKPILFFFTLPLTILTLGLFLLVLNAITFGIVGALTPGFTVSGFFPALFGSLILSFIAGILNQFFQDELG